jgi:alpha-tectorin
MLQLVLICVLSTVYGGAAYPTGGQNPHFYPYGPNEGDTLLHQADDSYSTRQDLGTVPLVFFENTYTGIYVNHNGVLTTNSGFSTFTSSPFPLNTNNPAIAPYWADVDTRGSLPGDGFISYRQSFEPTLLSRATTDALNIFSAETPTFDAAWIFVASWHEVTYYGNQGATVPTLIVTFQAVVMSDGTHSFALFNYGDDMHWTTGTASGGNRVTGLGGTPAQVGFDAGDGVNFYNLPGSQTNDIHNVLRSQSLIYRIDTNEVEAVCPAGFFSVTGRNPCTVCSINTYQSNQQSTRCIDCGVGERTLEAGSTSADACIPVESADLDPHFMISMLFIFLY